MTKEVEGNLTLHKECYVAVVPSGEVRPVVRDLIEKGIGTESVDAFCDSNVQENFDALSPERLERNAFQSAVRKLFGLHQVEAEKAYVEALESGESVLRVYVPEEDVETRREVEKVLLDHDSELIHYFGAWSFSKVAEDAERGGNER